MAVALIRHDRGSDLWHTADPVPRAGAAEVEHPVRAFAFGPDGERRAVEVGLRQQAPDLELLAHAAAGPPRGSPAGSAGPTVPGATDGARSPRPRSTPPFRGRTSGSTPPGPSPPTGRTAWCRDPLRRTLSRSARSVVLQYARGRAGDERRPLASWVNGSSNDAGRRCWGTPRGTGRPSSPHADGKTFDHPPQDFANRASHTLPDVPTPAPSLGHRSHGLDRRHAGDPLVPLAVVVRTDVEVCVVLAVVPADELQRALYEERVDRGPLAFGAALRA